MAIQKASPMSNKDYVAMMNDVVLKLWKPSQKEGMLTRDELKQIINSCDDIIDKYKNYTYTYVVKDNAGKEIRTEERMYIEDIALSTLELIHANEKQKREEENKFLAYLEGI